MGDQCDAHPQGSWQTWGQGFAQGVTQPSRIVRTFTMTSGQQKCPSAVRRCLTVGPH
jgi:hypothetical protein